MTNFMLSSDSDDVDAIINTQLTDGLNSIGIVPSSYVIDRYNKVDSTISDDFKSGAKKATIFSLLIIFLYIVFRFRKWQYGLGALIATTHDVLIVLSVFSIFWGILPFTMEIDQAFIAAILTVIGYSINDTVVVFDRIREYVGKLSGKVDDKTIINDALNSTLSRTINTSLSTFVVLLTIFSFGGDNIKGFIFALMVGVVVGTYSSIFIATPSVHDFSKSLKS
jgi:SecD/SecF fusion protein